MYRPLHHNESLMIVSLQTGIAVREVPGGKNRLEILEQAINRDLFRVEYVGEYLGRINQQLLDKPQTIA